MSVRSLILALKSLWFKKNPSTALSKTTTLSSSSVSSAAIISRNSRTNSGPIKLSGGLSNVIRQYLGEGRVSLICAIFAVSSARASYRNTIEIPYCDAGAGTQLLHDGIADTMVSRRRRHGTHERRLRRKG